MYQQALAGYKKALGSDHPFTQDTVKNLGLLYFDQGKLKEAEEMYQQVFAGYKKALGVDHPETRMIADNLEYLATLSAEHGDRRSTYPSLPAFQASEDNTPSTSLTESCRKRDMLFRIFRRK
ncbi:hypothetical protein BDW72DRAFT_184760 [Aspergillus terricola var. indicus]